jgi:hypothetical protein
MKKVINISIILLIIVFILGAIGYRKLKTECATEAAHVFMQPVSDKIFNEVFIPYPSDKENLCSSLINKVINYQKIELIKSSFNGVYVFKVSSYQNNSIILTIRDKGNNTWGVSCSEKI